MLRALVTAVAVEEAVFAGQEDLLVVADVGVAVEIDLEPEGSPDQVDHNSRVVGRREGILGQAQSC